MWRYAGFLSQYRRLFLILRTFYCNIFLTMKLKLTLLLILLTNIVFVVDATTTNERALWGSICGRKDAVAKCYASSLNKILLSWRMLPGDDAETAFDVYRRYGNGKDLKISKTPVKATNFCDEFASLTGEITYSITYAGKSDTLATYTMKADQVREKLPYISIPLKETSDVCSSDTIRYEANDISVGDLDGDGEMEIIVKRLLAHGEVDGTGSAEIPSSVRHALLYEAYKIDGSFLWRICSGPNILLGNSSSFAIADFDGDGKAEMAIKTGEGTIFGDGAEIGDTDGDGITDYRVPGEKYLGKGPEFLSVVDGITGKEIARTDYIARGKSEDWGDGYFKRAHSLRVGVGCFDGVLPSIIICRGVYAKSVVEAWDWRDGVLSKRWTFDSDFKEFGKDGKPYSAYSGQGFHSLSVGDVDEDGFDEVVYGSMTIDHDGWGLYSSKLGHGDALHLGKFDPSRKGLQIYSCLESGKTQVALRDALDGSIIWSRVSDKDNDTGRALIADIDPASEGCELWWFRSNAHSIDGRELDYKPGSCNMAIWFGSGLNRQLLNGTTIHSQFDNTRVFTVYRYDVSHINGSKENPSFYGDFLGDWREEVIYPDCTKVKDLKIFSTWMPTDHRFPWLMTDHVYHMSALNQNIGYNQPTQLGYYLGSDILSDESAWENGGYTSVSEIPANQSDGDGTIYNLIGVPVKNPAPGVYIQNRKKFVITK